MDRARQTQELSSVVNEMSDWLIMQGEDNVMGFDPAQYTPLLVRLVKGSDEFGPHLAHLSLRCITNMLDVIPSSSNVVVANGGADACVDKLASIEYVDVAEQVCHCIVLFIRRLSLLLSKYRALMRPQCYMRMDLQQCSHSSISSPVLYNRIVWRCL